jgi:tRNA(Ile)-lysidine synthase
VSAAAMAQAVRAAGAPLLVLLSGGRDSVCLLGLAVEVHGPRAVRALHVNYGLREEADADEALCRDLCGRLGVGLEVVRAGAPPAAGNLHAWARELRYAAAAERAGDARVAVAHTASDQVETILYRLAAAPGRRALLGMRDGDRGLARPLLAFSRDDTTGWCRDRGLSFRDDALNDDPAFARARVRHGVVPALAAVHPAAEANVLRTAELLRDEADVLEALVTAELEDGRIAQARLRSLPPALGRLVVQRGADEAAGRLVPGAARRAADVAALGPDSALDLGGGVRARVRAGVVDFGPSEGRAARA